MREKLRQYVSLLFAGTSGTEDMEQEILQNTLDRYDDLIAQGKSEEEAYRQAVAGIGDIGELLGKAAPEERAQTESDTMYTSMGRKICNAVAVALYVLCPVPLLLFQNELGIFCLLGMVACGVVIQILAGRLMDSLEERDPLSSGSRTAMNAAAVALYILCPAPLLIFQNELGIVCLLGMVAVGVAMQIVAGKAAVDTVQKPADPVQKNVKSLVNLLVLAIYLLVSFRTHAWWITWIIFPVADSLKKLVLALLGKHSLPKALVSVLLTVLLCSVLFQIPIAGSVTKKISTISDSLQGGTESAGKSFDASEVQALNIDWIDGSVSIQEGSGSTLSYTVSGSDAERSVYTLTDGTLSIGCTKGGVFLFGNTSHGQDITVLVPKGWTAENVSVEAVSAPVRVDTLNASKLSIQTVSGVIDLQNVRAEKLSVSSISARIDCSATARELDAETVSGQCTLDLTESAEKVSLNAVSGNMELFLPKNKGFTLDLDTVSGKFRTDFTFECPPGHDYQSGDGSCAIRADSVSGQVYVRQK